MRTKYNFAIAVFLVLFTVSPVFAHDGEVHEGATEPQVLPAQTNMAVEAPLPVNPVMRDAVKDLKTTINEKRDAAKEAAKIRKITLKEKLEEFQDMQKKAVMQRLDTRFETINDKSTQRWTTALEQMTTIVDRVSSEAANLEKAGGDTTEVMSAVTRARTAITTAETAVTTQAGKTYVMSVSSETGAQIAANTTAMQFRTDFRNTYTSVLKAKESVKDVVEEFQSAFQASINFKPVASESANVGE